MEDLAEPTWKRPEAFPLGEAGWGWVDPKGRRHRCASEEELRQAIIKDAGARVDMVWTPASPYLVLPEELKALWPALKEARLRWADWEMEEGRHQMLIFGIFIAAMVLFSRFTGGKLPLMGALGLALMLFLFLGFLPWYSGFKRRKRALAWIEGRLLPDLIGLRFETWLMMQRAPATRLLAVAIGIVALAQWLGPLTLPQQIMDAALVKVGGHAQDWWRLGTAVFLHGHPLHFIFNVSALLYLGRRMEVLVKWPHMILVFALSAWIGNECSARWIAIDSLGASGGLMGMLGFLLVFEIRHRWLVPQSSTRELVTGLVLTGLLGVVWYKMVDNAAHAGGLFTGMAYALLMFPRKIELGRRETGWVDKASAWLVVMVLLVFWGWTLRILLGYPA